LPVGNCLVHPTGLVQEVSKAVAEAHIGVLAVALLLHHLLIERDGLVELLLVLEVRCFLLELGEVGHREFRARASAEPGSAHEVAPRFGADAAAATHIGGGHHWLRSKTHGNRAGNATYWPRAPLQTPVERSCRSRPSYP